MQKLTIYRYLRPDGGASISLNKPDTEYTETYRLIADEGSILTNGVLETSCVDTDNPEAWEESDEITDTEALAIIMGGNT